MPWSEPNGPRPEPRIGGPPPEMYENLARIVAMVHFQPPPGMCGAEAVIAGVALGGIDRVVLGGGDGTLNASIPGLLQVGLPLGILPLGTANDLARSLGIPLALEAAARVIAEEQPRPVDLGEVNGHKYFNVASIGFSAELAGELKADVKRRWGKLGYAIAAFRLLRRARPFTVTLIHDGKVERVKTIQVSVGNGKHYGGADPLAAQWHPGAVGRCADLPHHSAGVAHPPAQAGEYGRRAFDLHPGGVPPAPSGAPGFRAAAAGLTIV